jgi:hypothetical protein
MTSGLSSPANELSVNHPVEGGETGRLYEQVYQLYADQDSLSISFNNTQNSNCRNSSGYLSRSSSASQVSSYLYAEDGESEQCASVHEDNGHVSLNCLKDIQ